MLSTVGRVAEWFKAPVLKTGVPARVPWVRIPPLPPVQNRTANAARSRFYARDGGERSEQIALRSHDADLAVGNLDPLGQRTDSRDDSRRLRSASACGPSLR